MSLKPWCLCDEFCTLWAMVMFLLNARATHQYVPTCPNKEIIIQVLCPLSKLRIWPLLHHRSHQTVAICLVLPVRWVSDAPSDICQLPPDICHTSTTYTPDISHISDRYAVDVWYMFGVRLVYIWYNNYICLVGIWYMSGVYVVLVWQVSGGSWQMSGGTSDRYLTIVWQ